MPPRLVPFSLTLVMLAMSACSKDSLVPLSRMPEQLVVSELRSSFCTTKPREDSVLLKFIFIIDESGSNNLQGSTDPTGTRRFDAIINFIDKANQSDNIFYSAIKFNDDAQILQTLTNDKSAFRNVIVAAKVAREDILGTNFSDALGRAIEVVEKDLSETKLAQKTKPSHYIVFHISDGFPTEGNTTVEGILSLITNLKGIADRESALVASVTLNTLYYYNNPDTRNQTLMQQMAVQGGGDFFEFNKEPIDFDRFNIPGTFLKHNLRDIFVLNTNAVWEKGDYVADSDSDGIGDTTELELGSNPYLADSDANGLIDGEELKINGSPCRDRQCRAKFADKLAACGVHIVAGATPKSFKDTDNDGLNDCAEALMKSDRLSADTNHDFVPDWMAFRNGLAFIKDAEDAFLDSDGDGLTNYEEVKLQTPKNFPNQSIPGLRPYKIQLDTVSEEEKIDCFNLTIHDVPVVGEHNRIAVHILESTPAVFEAVVIRRAEKELTGSVLQFTDEDFK